jgi:hypothetical protein
MREHIKRASRDYTRQYDVKFTEYGVQQTRKRSGERSRESKSSGMALVTTPRAKMTANGVEAGDSSA